MGTNYKLGYEERKNTLKKKKFTYLVRKHVRLPSSQSCVFGRLADSFICI